LQSLLVIYVRYIFHGSSSLFGEVNPLESLPKKEGFVCMLFALIVVKLICGKHDCHS